MREGLPPLLAKLHAQTLRLAKYFIKTSHGIGTKANGHMLPDPFLGTGQGAGDSMARWGFVSDAIIRTYNKHAQSAPIISPVSKRATTEHIQAFVDDTHGTMINNTTDPEEIINIIQHNMQAWEQILFSSGGKLELSKCKFCILQWQHNKEGTYKLIPSDRMEIDVIDSETKAISTTKAILPHEPYKLLGIMMALDGNCDAQIVKFSDKCNTLATAFNQLQLRPAEALQGYRSIFLPGARYGLSATNIPWNTMQSIQQTITNAVLPPLGFNRHTARPIVFAPEHFGGIGLYHMAVEQ